MEEVEGQPDEQQPVQEPVRRGQIDRVSRVVLPVIYFIFIFIYYIYTVSRMPTDIFSICPVDNF